MADDDLKIALTDPFDYARVIDAPRDVVFRAWTETSELKKWWGPKGTEIPHADNDLRPGGTFLYAMKMPDGAEMWGKWKYLEVVKPERLVTVVSFSDAKGGMTRHPFVPQWPLETLSTFTFDDEGDKTRVSLSWIPVNATPEEIGVFAAGHAGMTQGWGGTFDQLAAYIATLKR